MKHIEKLTPEQEAELPRFRQRYLDLACNGKRIDREALEGALVDAYAVIGKPAPKLFIFDSPAACMLALKIFELPREDFLKNSLWDQLGDQLWDQLGDQLWDQLGDQLRDQLWDQLGDQLGGQNLWNGNFLWGSQDLYWIAWARFAQRIGVKLKADTDKRLGIMERIGEQCEWWWPYESIVVACEKPLSVRWDDQRRLHGEGRAAVEYADGYSLFAWHGVSVPEKWITEKAITPHEALTWENMEQRRAACEILGWASILDQLKGKTIDKHANPEIGELIRVRIPDIGEEQFLRVRCGTGREFAIPVPPNMKSAAQANAWTYGFDNPTDYQLEVRT